MNDQRELSSLPAELQILHAANLEYHRANRQGLNVHEFAVNQTMLAFQLAKERDDLERQVTAQKSVIESMGNRIDIMREILGRRTERPECRDAVATSQCQVCGSDCHEVAHGARA